MSVKKGDQVRVLRAFDPEIYDVSHLIGRRGRVVGFDRDQPRLIVAFRSRHGRSRTRESFWDGEVMKVGSAH